MINYYTAICILSWMSLAVLCILVWKNGIIDKKIKRVFYLTYALIAVSLFAEWLGLELDGRAELPALPLYITKCADYILTPMAASAFVMQMQLKNIWSKILNVLLALNSVFQIVASFFGWVFVIDGNNHYSKGSLYYFYFAFCILVLTIVIIQFVLYSRLFPRRNQSSLYAIFILVIAGIAIQELLPGGYRTAYLSIALGSVLLFIHYTEFHFMRADSLLKQQKALIETDTLTGLLSRFAFTQELHALNEKRWLPEDFAVFVLDINGLKEINDTLGHSAGDELIIGAANCIRISMNEFAHCFRTGGDEFVVFTTMNKEQAEDTLRRLMKNAKAWSGRGSRHLSLAVGYVIAGDHPGFSAEQLLNEADRKMYESKNEFYQNQKRSSKAADAAAFTSRR